ncbi:nostrin isoform X1 [Astyanax mexicanus]|uniref:nostrin isoform X1 n=2 Tax=Astyanax mexicanus TaxID=7994 RepID=UPI0020CB1CFC|nr:nostrin isoform X1 [Astyanax mexicanus]
MKDPLGTCTYSLLYEDLKRFSKNGETFCKELVTVFQQRSELEINYAKGLQKLAGKLIKVSKAMSNNSTYNAWSLVSNEMFSIADAHRILGHALQQDTVLEIRQILDEHTKRKKPLDNTIEKSGKLVVTNWNEQLKVKKKLSALTREHEALFSFVEKNKQICTEKEKQKMFNRLTKSAELQVKVDEEYFNMNMDGHKMRLKWEYTLKSCYQIIQELEKQRIETLCSTLNKYSLHMSSYSQTLLQSEKQIEEAIGRVDVEKDLQTLVEDTCVTAEDTEAEFLMADYFEEDGRTIMGRERRRDALKIKLQRLEEWITRTKEDKDGLERTAMSSESTSDLGQRNTEETEQILDANTLKLDLLEATHCKLNQALMDLEGKPRPLHRFSNSIKKFKDKDCEHSTVKLSRPVKIKKTPLRSRQSLRTSIMYKGPAKNGASRQDSAPSTGAGTASAQLSPTEPQRAELNGALPHSEDEAGKGAEFCSIGKCKALYDYSSERTDELNIKEGDLLNILQKDDSGWWFGELNGERGHFPSTYIEELPILNVPKSSDA